MLRRTKDRYSPMQWSHGIASWHSEALAAHALNSLLKDRYDRGLKTWSMLLDNPWYAWRRDKFLVGQLELLRAEYRSALVRHFDELRNPPPVTVPYGATATFVRSKCNGQLEQVSVEEYRRYHEQPPIIIPMDDDDRKRQVVGAVIDISELTKGDIKPFDFRADVHHQDNTPSFGGAGASADWGGSSDTSAPDIDVPDLD